MKIAICISGGMKYPEKSLMSLRKIIPNDHKIFIHTWNITDKGSYLHNSGKEQLKPYGKKELISYLKDCTENDLDKLECYNYEKLLVENFEDLKPTFQEYFDSMTFSSYQRRDVGFFENLPFYSGPLDFNFKPEGPMFVPQQPIPYNMGGNVMNERTMDPTYAKLKVFNDTAYE